MPCSIGASTFVNIGLTMFLSLLKHMQLAKDLPSKDGHAICNAMTPINTLLILAQVRHSFLTTKVVNTTNINTTTKP